jgi:hypothetical protein
MSRVFRQEYFIKYNGFYGKNYCRSVVFSLYNGECVTCRQQIENDNFHVAHIIPRSHPVLMKKYYPDLDVDNLLNLKLSCPRCNIMESNVVVDSLMLQGAFNTSARIIASRLDSVLAKLKAVVRRVEMSGADPRICTDIFFIDAREIRDMVAADWHGALVVPRSKLDARVAEAVRNTLGSDGDDWTTYHAVDEAIGVFRNVMEITSGSSYSIDSDGCLPWLNEVRAMLRRKDEYISIPERVKDAGLIDGIYVDPDELSARGGMSFPLRTEVQRWFRDIFVTINWAQGKLDRSGKCRYIALDEHEWQAICECFDKLRIIESGIGKVGRRLKIPAVVAHFGLQRNKLRFGEEGISISDEVRRMCAAVATDSVWGGGTLILKATLRTWLVRAFTIADHAVREAVGPRLMLVDDKGSFYRRWVPRLPKLG